MAETQKTGHTTGRLASQAENIKDTIESLVIAFILAFVFRGFLVEAFVIPTGSMAPTLYGMHGSQVCPDCGWEYAYGIPQDLRCKSARDIRCPNCGRESATHEEIPYHTPKCDLLRYSANPKHAQRLANLDFAPQSGDRILVFKWPFDLGGSLLGPKPWDIVVFKNPANGEDNYIKRLIGKPGEVLEIIDGDIYTCPSNELDEASRAELQEVLRLKQRLQKSHFHDARAYRRMMQIQRGLLETLAGKLRIRRKTELAQKSLWHVVYDHDYLPMDRGLNANRARWQVEGRPTDHGGWDTSSRRIRFEGQDLDRQTIRFAGKPIRDFYAYNFDTASSEPEQDASDIRVRFVLRYHAGQGLLGLSLSKHDDSFALECHPDGQITLSHRKSPGQTSAVILAGAKVEPWRTGEPREFEFGNVDYRVYAKVDGRLVLSTTDDDYAPDIARLRRMAARGRSPSTVQIYAEHVDIELLHVALDRDIYYKNSEIGDRPAWGVLGNPILLRTGEYFVLGDNSPASQDSRLWRYAGRHLVTQGSDYQVGTVPADQLIGKAFFVYWPMGYRIRWLPVLKNFGVVPNFGKMRWIR